jgi:hypothetical protein
MTQSVQVKGNDGTVALVDSITPALVTIDSVHQHHHAGILYTAWFTNLTLGAGADIELLVRTLAGQAAHMAQRSSAEAETLVSFFEDPTSTDDGTPIAAVNRNRITANTADTLVFEGPTLTGDGTPLTPEIYNPGGSGGNAPGATSIGFGEFILAPDTDYLIRLNNPGGGAIQASLVLDWYEPA